MLLDLTREHSVLLAPDLNRCQLVCTGNAQRAAQRLGFHLDNYRLGLAIDNARDNSLAAQLINLFSRHRARLGNDRYSIRHLTILLFLTPHV
jgi:hypothetical protein